MGFWVMGDVSKVVARRASLHDLSELIEEAGASAQVQAQNEAYVILTVGSEKPLN